MEDVQAKAIQEKRRSEHLKKDITLTTNEKTERMAKKRNLEGNPCDHNMFFVLPIDELAELTSAMGG